MALNINKRWAFLITAFLFFYSYQVIADVADITEPNHPVSRSTGPMISSEEKEPSITNQEYTTHPAKHYVNLKMGYAYDYFAGSEKLVSVDVTPKAKLGIYLKGGEGQLFYNSAKNSWETQDHQPDCYAPKFVGNPKIAAYGQPGNLMADGCTHGMTILTNQPYAIEIWSTCDETNDEALREVLKTIRLLKPVTAVKASCTADATEIGGWSFLGN
jgi:hypothetical protein